MKEDTMVVIEASIRLLEITLPYFRVKKCLCNKRMKIFLFINRVSKHPHNRQKGGTEKEYKEKSQSQFFLHLISRPLLEKFTDLVQLLRQHPGN